MRDMCNRNTSFPFSIFLWSKRRIVDLEFFKIKCGVCLSSSLNISVPALLMDLTSSDSGSGINWAINSVRNILIKLTHWWQTGRQTDSPIWRERHPSLRAPSEKFESKFLRNRSKSSHPSRSPSWFLCQNLLWTTPSAVYTRKFMTETSVIGIQQEMTFDTPYQSSVFCRK